MANKTERTCVSVGVAADGTNSVLVVSTDEERVEYLSTIFEYEDFLKNATGVVFQESEQIASMWMSATGKYYLSEALGSCYTNASGSFVRTQVTDANLYVTWGLHDRAVYTAGSKGAFFKFDGQAWSAMSLPAEVNTFAIHGLREDLLVCVGDQGYVARWDGDGWTQLEIPTKVGLRSVHVENEQLIYLGGAGGACFRLRDGEFESIKGGTDTIEAIASWRGDFYAGTHHAGIFKLNGNALETVRAERPAAHIQSSKDFLYAGGLNKYTRFDGTDWKSRPFT